MGRWESEEGWYRMEWKWNIKMLLRKGDEVNDLKEEKDRKEWKEKWWFKWYEKENREWWAKKKWEEKLKVNYKIRGMLLRKGENEWKEKLWSKLYVKKKIENDELRKNIGRRTWW